jgi:hypothetical protein
MRCSSVRPRRVVTVGLPSRGERFGTLSDASRPVIMTIGDRIDYGFMSDELKTLAGIDANARRCLEERRHLHQIRRPV